MISTCPSVVLDFRRSRVDRLACLRGRIGCGGIYSNRFHSLYVRFESILLFSTAHATQTVDDLLFARRLVVCLLTWFDVWRHTNVIRAGNCSSSPPPRLLSVSSPDIGAGIVLYNRSFFAWYTFTCVTSSFLAASPTKGGPSEAR